MARKNDEMTPRQRQSRQIMREKSARKKRKIIIRKASIVFGGIIAISLLVGSTWLWQSGKAARTAQSAVDWGYNLSVNAGYSVQTMYLEGRNRTSMEEIDKALGIKKGDPIFRFSIDEARERLEKIESIKTAAVERSLPNTVYVRIVEREPIALWQHEGKVALVDDNGAVMKDIDITPYKKLPLLVGDSAPAHIKELLAILGSEPDLSKRMSSAIRISDRRWNIRLSVSSGSNIEVWLPENNPIEAWKKLADLQARQQLLDRDVKVIDLRLEGKMFIKLAPEDSHSKIVSAKET